MPLKSLICQTNITRGYMYFGIRGNSKKMCNQEYLYVEMLQEQIKENLIFGNYLSIDIDLIIRRNFSLFNNKMKTRAIIRNRYR